MLEPPASPGRPPPPQPPVIPPPPTPPRQFDVCAAPPPPGPGWPDVPKPPLLPALALVYGAAEHSAARRARGERVVPFRVMADPRAVLDKHSDALREALRAALTERVFPPHGRFRRSAAPALDDGDALTGIYVQYDYQGWVPVIFGLSRAAATKCTGRCPFSLNKTLDPELDDVDPDLVDPALEAWITDAWRAVRGVAPELRGFISQHESDTYLDLDTGECASGTQIGMGWL